MSSSSAAYAHQVPRLISSSSATKLMANSMSSEHQNSGRPPNNNSALHHNNHNNNHERKWRVLVSIGLLLPALAAIIGIVAWTISIEVANNEHQTTTSHHHNVPQRRVHEQQQQQQQQQAVANQFRRDEALALAAMLTAKRQQWATAMAAHSDNKRPATSESEPTGSSRLPVAAAVVKPRQTPMTMTQPTSRPTRSSGKQHQMSKNDEQPALMMLKNLDQVETLEQEERSNNSGADQEADSSESKSAARQPEADEITSPTSGRPVAAEASSEAANSAPDDDATAQDVEVIEQQQQQQDEEQTMKQKSTGGAQLAFEEQAAIAKQSGELNRGHKSRWHAKRPIAMVSEPSATKKSSKQPVKKQQEAAAKLNSKYTLVNSHNNNNSQQNDQEEREQSDESTGEEVATSTSMSTAPASTTTSERPDCRDHADETKSAPTDDDVSFEAIASAISKTLSESQAQNDAGDSGDSTTSFVNDNSEGQAQSDDEKPPIVQNDSTTTTKQRRRTTGEHLAEVIDHLVDRRKSGARFGDRTAEQMSSYTQEGDSSPRQGPQIVVVAPVGPSGALLKARSLTKTSEPEVAKSSASGSLKKPVEAIKKTIVQLVKSSSFNSTKSRAPLGARLLGVGSQLPVADSQLKQYSERVQVIEDDDSSALLMVRPAPTGSAALTPTSGADEYSSVHVSSHAGEPRLRTARHELSSRHFLERYAPMIVPQQRDSTIVRRTESPVAPASAKLYSAEQLIRNHILKSKVRSQSESSAARAQQPATGSQGAPNATTTTTTTTTTTSAPPTGSTSSSAVITSSTTAQPPTLSEQQNRQQQVYDAGIQSVQVPAFFMQQQQQQQFNPRSQMFKPQQQQLHNQDPYQVMESQQQQQQVQLPATGSGPLEYSEQQQQQQQHAALPTFADQEIQVPAHLADSVIRDLQQSASQVTGMLNGQPTLFQALPPALQHQHQQQMAQVPFNYYQHQQRNPMHQMQNAESQQRPHFMMNNEQQQMAPNHLAYPFNSHFMSRAVAVARQQQQQQQLEHNQRLANRDTLSAGKEEAVLQQQQQRPVEEQEVRITPLKALTNPRSLVQPMAQMALKHLFTSLGQQAAAQQAQLEANEQHRRRHRSSPATISPADSKSSEASGSIQQASGSSPVGVAALPAAASSEPAAARSMRSLPIGAQAPPSQQQVQLVQDQEAQESQGGYGGGPAYQMAHEPMHNYGGGGGGGHQQYSDDADKKSKGITFHFGGGPIGGGTQLITSPMGIFKHLMIPLMPNPRVNLNGKVVFGVVLEKSTAFGPPPKKKYKFWGR